MEKEKIELLEQLLKKPEIRQILIEYENMIDNLDNNWKDNYISISKGSSVFSNRFF